MKILGEELEVRRAGDADRAWLDGMQICEGCRDVFVLSGLCRSCECIRLQVEARLPRRDPEPDMVHALRAAPIDRIGVTPWAGIIASSVIGAGIVALCLLWFIPRLTRAGLWAAQ